MEFAPQNNPEINHDLKEELEHTARSLAPYEEKCVAEPTWYRVKYDTGNHIVSIDVPTMPEEIDAGQGEDEVFYEASDELSVIVNEVLDPQDDVVPVRSRHYSLYLSDYETDYTETIELYRMGTWEKVKDPSVNATTKEGLLDIVRRFNADKELGNLTLTEQRYKELQSILSTLHPSLIVKR